MPEKLNIPNGTSHDGHLMPLASSCQSDGSFFINGLSNTENVNRLPYSPVDELTGVPLILHPDGSARDRGRYPADKHHPWHPRRDPLVMAGTLGGEALRSSRIQLTSYDAHHLHYHGHFHGPELPVDDQSRFKLIVLTAAGYIPEQALVFSSKRPYLKEITLEQRLKLWRSGQVRVDKPGIVRDFLKDYSLSQDILGMSERAIDEFLFTRDPIKRWELGNNLLGKVVLRATMPIKDAYKEAYKAELLPPNRARKASKFVLSSLGIGYQRNRLLEELEQRLKLAVA